MATLSRPNLDETRVRTMGLIGEFKAFILRGNVIDLAVGIVIGVAFTAVVTAFVSDIITPIIPTGTGKGLATVTYTIPFTGDKLLVGAFVNSVISFIILAFIIFFFVVRPVNALVARSKKKEVPAPEAATTTRDCPYCASSISLKAVRCPYCTSDILAPTQEGASA
jgi:large conductance mechanosensitive channel